ncbi:MAG: tetratricopeptide repeat protein [Oscillochloridaceae bacterium]|nr:tetratricopeptide repeat protein [Chloroflexaceae bacterium]MDW8389324.1 tetratricopeptide repeat protein [Oscillochloridaceae bacterium]
MLPSFRENRAGCLLIGVCVLVGLVALYAAAPRLAGMFFIQRGAALLATDPAGQNAAILTESLSNFQRAADLLPDDPLPLRYMARVYQLDGRVDEALTVLEKALSLRPDSVLIQTDLLRAYVLTGHPDHALELSAALGYTPDRFVVVGDEYRRSGDYAQALRWFDVAAYADAALASHIVFHRLVSAALARDPQAFEVLHEAQTELPDLQAPQVGVAPVAVPGAAFRRVEALSQPPFVSGTPLNHPYGGSTGVFWGNGQATLLVQVARSGAYVVRVTVVNTVPPPIQLAFGANGLPLHQVSLVAGDNTQSVVEFPVMLTTPLSTVDIWFLNDANVQGLDRNAYIEQVEILPAPSSQ